MVSSCYSLYVLLLLFQCITSHRFRRIDCRGATWAHSQARRRRKVLAKNHGGAGKCSKYKRVVRYGSLVCVQSQQTRVLLSFRNECFIFIQLGVRPTWRRANLDAGAVVTMVKSPIHLGLIANSDAILQALYYHNWINNPTYLLGGVCKVARGRSDSLSSQMIQA